ncbi:MAG: hypothetical protein NTW03_16825, partial [Verrucomicrobia bacterium]|nr:hypothetical protein [Verrucomicrobiota bacterium]
ADAGLERAKAEMIAQITKNNALMGYDETVSRSISNLATALFVDPRVPVFVNTNRKGTVGPLENRFYLDLNRNGFFEDTILTNNGSGIALCGDPQWIGLLEKPYRKHDGNNRFIGRYAFLVVPSGKALDVNWIHNRFRLASVKPHLSFNYMRDQGFGPWELNLAAFLAVLSPPVWGGPNNYQYDPDVPAAMVNLNPRTGNAAFADAASVIAYRFSGQPSNYYRLDALYGPRAVDAFRSDLIDGYANAQGVMGAFFPTMDPDSVLPLTSPWPGADSAHHYFSHQDFFDPNKIPTIPTPFTNRLGQATALDPYVFYRMLAQLGTDSAPVDDGKIHLNYVNQPVALGTLQTLFNFSNNYFSVTSSNLTATNFVPWTWPGAPELAVQFFTNAAQKLFENQFWEFNPAAFLATVNGQTVTNGIINITNILSIPVAPTNLYSPALHRLLQVAANIYDATRNDRFPSVFRPLFTTSSVVSNGVTNVFVYITGYTNDNKRSTLRPWLADNKNFGIPLVIGAKKGFPNFNEYTFRTDVTVTRKLEFVRKTTNTTSITDVTETNQMYVIGISNQFGAEAWNSYQAPYDRTLTLEYTDIAWLKITNQAGLSTNANFQFAGIYPLPANFWQGRQFVLPLYTNLVLLPPSAYRFATRTFDPINTNVYEQNVGFPVPELRLSVSNQFIYILTDRDSDSIVDFVLSQDFGAYVDIDGELMNPNAVIGINGAQTGVQEDNIIWQLWDTNRDVYGNLLCPTHGVLKQTDVALGNVAVSDTTWRNYLNDTWSGQDMGASINAIRKFMGFGAINGAGTATLGMTSLRMQAPFCPSRKFLRTCTWQANDPLVHYHVGDMLIVDPAAPGSSNVITEAVVPACTGVVPTNMALATLGALNNAYAPWGGNPKQNSDPLNSLDPNVRNLMIKDPGVRSSDDWDFPHGKFASIGWLGRIHRGTPWQTIYLKPGAADETMWRQQSSDCNYCLWPPDPRNPLSLKINPVTLANTYALTRSHPTNDWILADFFTIATDPNSTRGLLSINQANLAAWSAVLSGVDVLQNLRPDTDLLMVSTNDAIPLTEKFIQPAANDTNVPPSIVTLVNAINNFRRTLPNETFTHVGQLLQVPELTVSSPWLNLTPIQQLFGLTDAAYERLPQQILSLVKVGDPRFVIYAYGQALKPARDSIDSSRGNVCTNYQVTAEVATRAVLRVEGTPGRPRVVIESFNVLPPD